LHALEHMRRHLPTVRKLEKAAPSNWSISSSSSCATMRQKEPVTTNPRSPASLRRRVQASRTVSDGSRTAHQSGSATDSVVTASGGGGTTASRRRVTKSIAPGRMATPTTRATDTVKGLAPGAARQTSPIVGKEPGSSRSTSLTIARSNSGSTRSGRSRASSSRSWSTKSGTAKARRTGRSGSCRVPHSGTLLTQYDTDTTTTVLPPR